MNVNRIEDFPAARQAVAATQAPAPVSRARPASAPKDEPSPEQVKSAVSQANKHLAATGQRLEMSWDDESRQVLVKLVDAGTKEVIRQIPTEEAVTLAKRLASLAERFEAHA